MNYESMSDFEINKRVANSKWPDFVKYEQFGKLRVQDPNGDDFYFDFNNPSDAWPIIIENSISIVKSPDGLWGASDLYRKISFWDKNPLRAAMIVYLMMQEASDA